MANSSDLAAFFETYWDDLEKCRGAKAYWSLLHVIVCLPDICSALESASGETKKRRYVKWCNRWFKNPKLNGAERYRMRCKLLHQGRASRDRRGRYAGFSFGQPSSDGSVDHMRLDRRILEIDVGELFKETKDAVGLWLESLEATPRGHKIRNVKKNLKSVVKVRAAVITTPGTGGVVIFETTKTN